MLARVLLVLLAVPVCRGSKGAKGAAYSWYYNADEDVQNADFYDSYNDEIKSLYRIEIESTTRLKRRDLDDVRTLNPKEIVDEKGALKDILQGNKHESLRGRRTARDYSDSYDYLENSISVGPEAKPEQGLAPDKWQPTGEVRQGTPTVEDLYEYLEDSSSQATEQHWSFVYEPETSTYGNDDIIAEVKKMIPVRDGQVPRRSSIDLWRPTQKVQTWGTTEETEETEDTLIYPLETTMYSNSDMLAAAKKLVQPWSSSSSVNMQEPTTTYSNSDMQAEVRKLVQHWSSISSANIQEPTTTYSNSDMQAEVRKLVQHWSSKAQDDSSSQESSSYNSAAMRAAVRQLVQHWSPRGKGQHREQSTAKGKMQEPTTTYSNSDMQAEVRKLVQHWSSISSVNMNQQNTGIQTEVTNLDHWNPILDYNPSVHVQRQNPSMNVQHWSSSDSAQTQISSDNVPHRVASDIVKPQNLSLNVQHWNPSLNVQHQNPSINVQHWSSSQPVQQGSSSENVQHWSPNTHVQQWDPIAADYQENLTFNASITDPPIRDETETDRFGDTRQMWNDSYNIGKSKLPLTFNASITDPPIRDETETDRFGDTRQMWNDSYNIGKSKLPLRGYERQGKKGATTKKRRTTTTRKTTTTRTTTTRTTTTTTTTTTPTTTTPTTTTQPMDIDAIMAIISNLTYDYEWNLTEQFNKTIIQHGVPTCPWEKWGPGGVWTRPINGTTEYPWDFENASVVSKCFVCGLKTTEIPRNAYCGDAFAGDFLPLMPIDAQSRGKIAGFRKYCRYIDAQNYIENPDEPRAIYGRFTGGCAVRWTDITGVYTQRTCRSKFRPLMGKHFASKRMAKLELALVNVENGCIISPMATLLPVSRGISLYARFHACVCSTNWCNQATVEQASLNTLATVVLAYWLVHYP